VADPAQRSVKSNLAKDFRAVNPPAHLLKLI